MMEKIYYSLGKVGGLIGMFSGFQLGTITEKIVFIGGVILFIIADVKQWEVSK